MTDDSQREARSVMELSQSATGEVVDLTDCDKEPIHIPGKIQSHGILFALTSPGLVITQLSGNAGTLTGRGCEELLGTSIESLIAPEARSAIMEWLRSGDFDDVSNVVLAVKRDGILREVAYDAIAHRSGDRIILEVENPQSDGVRASVDPTRGTRRAMARLQAAHDLRDFCHVAAAEVQLLTGFERVIVYRFDPDWHGEVFAEVKASHLAPLFGLHFPASDIPEQARMLYHVNRIRLIANTHDDSVPLVPNLDSQSQQVLDLSASVLRSVSPVHIQYLKNMGARTSMSISLMREGRLWGLISCMNYDGARYVTLPVRAACEFLATLVSVQLALKEDSEGYEYSQRLHGVREQLLETMLVDTDLSKVFSSHREKLLEIAGADGAAVVVGDVCSLIGSTPDETQVKELVVWLKKQTLNDVFHTDSLGRIYPPAVEFKHVASGLLAITTGSTRGQFILWFRPEVIQSVAWGGDPTKPVEGHGTGTTLTPRKSFELWKEEVRLKSLPWHPAEVNAASLLRNAVLAVFVKRAEELARLNAELERSNSDLDAFAFTTSHDLKEPLRGIHNYATFLMEDYQDKLDVDGVSKLESLVRLSQRMEDLVESLLRFSRLGREEMVLTLTDLNVVVSELQEMLRVFLDEHRVEVRIPRPLPSIPCDRAQIVVLFANLLTNAVKYNDKQQKCVEIGCREPNANEPGSVDDAALRHVVFYVRDNGIGIPEKHSDIIFRLFKRLHARDKFGGGTGAGLTFVKKIVERHGGSIWIDSVLGEGTTFYFTLGG